MKLHILLPDGAEFTKEYAYAVTAEMLAEEYREHCPFAILTCRIDSGYKRLNRIIDEDCEVELYDMRNPYANMSYQTSLSFLYITAVHDVLGKDVRVGIANSLSKGLFTIIHHRGLCDEDVQAIQERMHFLQKQKVEIKEVTRSRDDLLKIRNTDIISRDERDLLATAYDLRRVYEGTLNQETELFYQHLLPDTSYLNLFELRRYRTGVLLRFPHTFDPSGVPDFEEQKLLYDAFSEETHWERVLGMNLASDLNREILKRKEMDMILLSEALHEKKIAEIADQISRTGKRIILIAGPSSSGKTTFAKRLCIQLKVNGLKPLYLGTDDYFVNRADQIPDENGNLDFESLKAVDTALFTEQMNALLQGKEADIPEFDFIKGEKVFGKRITAIEADQPIVIEGIHGLNPALTKGIADDQKFRIYISPLTQLNIDEHHRIPTTDARMLRRIVRDYRNRGRSAAETIAFWPSVRAGEEVNIFPYNGQADVFFNSQCIYELAVLKKYAEPLLKEITYDMKEYPEAQRMLGFLQCFVTLQNESFIPNNSIIREFIGGSILVG